MKMRNFEKRMPMVGGLVLGQFLIGVVAHANRIVTPKATPMPPIINLGLGNIVNPIPVELFQAPVFLSQTSPSVPQPMAFALRGAAVPSVALPARAVPAVVGLTGAALAESSPNPAPAPASADGHGSLGSLEELDAAIGKSKISPGGASAAEALGRGFEGSAPRPAANAASFDPSRLEFSDRIPKSHRALLPRVFSREENMASIERLAAEALQRHNRQVGGRATLADVNLYVHYFSAAGTDYVYQVVIELRRLKIGVFVATIDKAMRRLTLRHNDD